MKVLLADPKSNIRYGLTVLLGEQPDLEIVGETDDSGVLLAQVKATSPDLLLLSWDLPGMKVSELLGQIRILCPKLSIIALSGKSNNRELALQSGADDFICKGDSPEKLLASIRQIQNQNT